MQESSLKRELTSLGQTLDIRLFGDWEFRVKEYLADLQAGLESLSVAPQSDEERQEIFVLKKQIVNTLVSRVTIDQNRELHVEISLNLLSLLNADPTTRGQNWPGGTYSHIPDLYPNGNILQ